MANKNSSLFGDIASSVSVADKSTASKPAKARYLSDRRNNISGLVSGSIEEKTLHWVDPDECKMWAYHNRRYDLLDESRCKDLIEGIRSQGKQEFPAIVRRTDDPDYKYEVICGARRHWTISYLRSQNYNQFKFLVEIRDMTDEEAFRISDVENRDRQDISDYERAVDYSRAVKNFYSSQKNMAERLEVSQAWLSRYLDLAKIPDSIIGLFSDLAFITVEHGKKLKPIIKEPKSRKELLFRAEQIESAKTDSRFDWNDEKIFNFLMHGEKPKSKSLTESYSLPNKKEKILKIKKDDKGNLTLSIKPIQEGDRSDLLNLVMSVLETQV